jgi:aspartyl aminopeptidase
MKLEALKLADDLIDFIGRSPTAFHCVLEIENRLVKNGYTKLDERDPWSLVKGGKYYVERNNSSLVAFISGQKDPWETGFKLAGAHTDSPSLKIKNKGASVVDGLLRLSVEPYGGGIHSTWLDRSLSLAGRIVLDDEGGGGIHSLFIDFKDPIGVIPNQAIHMNQDMNKGIEYNKQKHLQVILGQIDENSGDSPDVQLKKIIATRSGIDFSEILDMELYLYDVQPGMVCGLNREFISSARLDNLAMCHSITKSLLELEGKQDETVLAVFFDNEEIGSTSFQGADSSFLRDLLDRIILVAGGDHQQSSMARAKSFSLSADGVHAFHPNYPDSHDPHYKPLLNGGPVIKMNSNQRYSSTSQTASLIKKLCREAGVPVQEVVYRSDLPVGSTIGPITSSLTGIRSVDIGSPMFAMHSIRETSGVVDHFYMSELLKRYFKYDLNSY